MPSRGWVPRGKGMDLVELIRREIYPLIGQDQNSGLHSRIFHWGEVGKKTISAFLTPEMNSMGPNYPEKVLLVSFAALLQSQQVFRELSFFEGHRSGLHCQIDHGK